MEHITKRTQYAMTQIEKKAMLSYTQCLVLKGLLHELVHTVAE